MYFSYKKDCFKTAVSSIFVVFSFMVEQEMLKPNADISKIDVIFFHC